jgi:two-component system, OmpR family, response regulator QseB
LEVSWTWRLGRTIAANTAAAARIGEDGAVDPASSEPARLLLVEDDQRLVEMLTGLLVDEGYAVESAPDGQRGLHLGLTREYDLLVLDRGLPAIEGLDLLARLRSRGVTTPALVLSALGNPSDRVEGLDAGAEDYLAKPFDLGELLARLRALLRRHVDTSRSLTFPGGRLDLDSRQVAATSPLTDDGAQSRPADEEPVQLSERECGLLATLAGRPTRVFSRSELLAAVFEDAESTNVIDTYVHYLRRKLGRRVVKTVRGGGYQMGRL